MGTAAGRWVLAATIGGSSMAMLDSTVVNVALARIGQDLDAGFASLQWISNAYTLTLASFILIGGVLGDRYGRRRVFVIGTVWFGLASAVCALAPTSEVLVAARALQGVGGALLTPGSLAIISASFARADRARAVGAWSGLGGVASAIGPFLGGWLVMVNWRLVFLINLPVAAAVVLIAAAARPRDRGERGGHEAGHPRRGLHRRRPERGDVRAHHGRADRLERVADRDRSGRRLALMIAFVLVERASPAPLVPLSLFADRVFAATNLATLFIYAALSVYFFLVVLQLQLVAGWSPLAAGTSMLPVTAADAAAVGPCRRAVGAGRSAAADDARRAAGGGGNRAGHPDRAGRLLSDRRPAVGACARSRTVLCGGAADRRRARRGARSDGRRGVGGEQRRGPDPPACWRSRSSRVWSASAASTVRPPPSSSEGSSRPCGSVPACCWPRPPDLLARRAGVSHAEPADRVPELAVHRDPVARWRRRRWSRTTSGSQP